MKGLFSWVCVKQIKSKGFKITKKRELNVIELIGPSIENAFFKNFYPISPKAT